MFVKIAPLWIVISLFAVTASAEPKQWQTYDGYNPEGYGRHIVIISGEGNYRSEESLPQLAKILAVRHGIQMHGSFRARSEKPRHYQSAGIDQYSRARSSPERRLYSHSNRPRNSA